MQNSFRVIQKIHSFMLEAQRFMIILLPHLHMVYIKVKMRNCILVAVMDMLKLVPMMNIMKMEIIINTMMLILCDILLWDQIRKLCHSPSGKKKLYLDEHLE